MDILVYSMEKEKYVFKNNKSSTQMLLYTRIQKIMRKNSGLWISIIVSKPTQLKLLHVRNLEKFKQ